MTRLAKAPSTFTPGRHSGRVAVLALAMALILLAINATGASAEKYFSSSFGATSASNTVIPPTPSGTAFGGFFSSSSGGIGAIAVNDSSSDMNDGNGTEGWSYVNDTGNHRVQAFDQNGAFKWAIGRNVIAPSVSEVQILEVKATAGKFKLGLDAATTAVDIDWNTTAAILDTRVGELVGGATNVVVTGNPATATLPGYYAIQFSGTKANLPQNQITVQPGSVALTGTASVSTLADGIAAVPGDLGDVLEKCTVAAHCKAGATGSEGGMFNTLAGISIDQPSGEIYTRERNSNARIQHFEADGTFIRAFGWDVVQPGGTGEVIDDLDEVQTVALSTSFGNVSGGTFTLSFDPGSGAQVTDLIPFNAPAAPDPAKPNAPISVQERLEGLAAFAPGDLVVTSNNPGGEGVAGGPYIVHFTGAYTATNVAQLVGNGAGLTTTFATPGLVNVATAIAGGPGPGFETCTVATQCKASTTGLGVLDGQFGSITDNNLRSGVAIAPADAPNAGTLYAPDQVNCRVVSFDVSAATVSPGESFGRCGNTEVDHFSPPLPPTLGQPTSVLAASDGTVYASNSTRVNRYDTQTGTFLTRIAPLSSNNGIALDPESERLFVSQSLSEGVVEIDVSGQPDVLDITARTMDRHFANSGMSGNEGTPFRSLALDPGTSRLFGATINSLAGTGTNGTTTGVSSHRVLVLDDIGMSPQPTVTMLPPEDVETTTATLKAQVNPNGVVPFPTSYRFQVSKDGGAEWIDVTSPELVGGTGTGNTPVAVQKAVSGLEPGTAYLVRVLATRGVAGRLASAAIAMPTDPAPPLPSTGPAQHVADTSAQLTGTLNAGGLQTEYWFEWGEGSLTDEVPVPRAMAPASGAAIEVAESLTGLDPDTTYQFRLCATNALELTPVCGSTRTLHTRQGAASPDPTRAYEMVTSAEKALRRGGEGKHTAKYSHLDYQRMMPGFPAIGGGRVMNATWAGVGDPDAGHGFACEKTWEVRERQPGGLWIGNAIFNVAPPRGGAPCIYGNGLVSASANLDTTVFAGIGFPPFDLGGVGDDSGIGVRELDGTGGPLSAGWYPWLDASWMTGNDVVPPGGPLNHLFSGSTSDSGQQLVGQVINATPTGRVPGGEDVLPADGGPAAEQLSPAQAEGGVVMRSNAAAEWRPLDLVNECTGSLGGGPDPHQAPTLLPSRTAGGEIGTRECGAGSPTDVRGGALGSGSSTTSARAMSEDGRRIFFLSPDPTVAGTGQSSCGTGTAAATRCPAQLFVRAFDSQGNPVVRWISRAESSLFAAPQQIGLLGNGVVYEGAAKDGDVVYFRTNAPLTADDPNAGSLGSRPVTTGTASSISWDLYRYELPAGDADPGAGTLTRITGGPAGEDDPNVSCLQSAADCGGSANGKEGNALRFLSDDGERAYFVSAGRIGEAADPLNEPPAGSSAANVAVDAPSSNTATRNLYLHDAESDTYRFVAALPFSGESEDLDSCASSFGRAFGPPAGWESDGRIRASGANCIHGSSSGDAIAFTTSAQLTEDDTDADFDIYAYDATVHELTRVSAPPPNTSAYPCVHEASFESEPDSLCNADMGQSSSSRPGSESTAGRHWGIAQDNEGHLTAVYFQTRLPLAEGDSNSYDAEASTGGMDVYQWRRADGRISLVSPGTSDDSAFFSGNSLDGKDVFFWTEQRISPWEIENADGDIYNWTSRTDLRPDPPPPPPACNVLGGACQGQAPIAPPANGAASAQLKGEGNVVQPKKPRRCTKGKVRKGKRCVVKKQKSAKRADRTAKNDRRASR